MKILKPEKVKNIYHYCCGIENCEGCEDERHNQACDEWQRYHESCIPSESELYELITCMELRLHDDVASEIAEAISKRLHNAGD